jgi:5'-nucleotidase
MLILLTNDDGLFAPGLDALADALADLGTVRVAAPDRNQSGVAHQISLHAPLRSHEVRPGWFMVQGTPADCVYLALHELLPERPRVVVSGINAGPNLSYDVHYSGTVGGAMEGTLMGIPSVAISATQPARGYAPAAGFARALVARVLEDGLPPDTLLNVNVPPGAADRYQMTRLGHRLFRHHVERRDDPRGTPYYWIGGVPRPPEDRPGSDCNAVGEGVVSVTPLSVDITHEGALRGAVGEWVLEGPERVASVADAPPTPPRFHEDDP